MRWEQLLDDRSDSERPMSLVIKGGSFGEFGPGDLQMLLLRLDRGEGGVRLTGGGGGSRPASAVSVFVSL